MNDLDPFDRQELEILLHLVTDHGAKRVIRYLQGNLDEGLRTLKNKLTAQLAVAEKPAAIRSWRDSGVAWFWSDAREDYGSVILEDGRYVATTVRGSATFEVLGDAKDFVEEHSS